MIEVLSPFLYAFGQRLLRRLARWAARRWVGRLARLSGRLAMILVVLALGLYLLNLMGVSTQWVIFPPSLPGRLVLP